MLLGCLLLGIIDNKIIATCICTSFPPSVLYCLDALLSLQLVISVMFLSTLLSSMFLAFESNVASIKSVWGTAGRCPWRSYWTVSNGWDSLTKAGEEKSDYNARVASVLVHLPCSVLLCRAILRVVFKHVHRSQTVSGIPLYRQGTVPYKLVVNPRPILLDFLLWSVTCMHDVRILTWHSLLPVTCPVAPTFHLLM